MTAIRVDTVAVAFVGSMMWAVIAVRDQSRCAAGASVALGLAAGFCVALSV